MLEHYCNFALYNEDNAAWNNDPFLVQMHENFFCKIGECYFEHDEGCSKFAKRKKIFQSISFRHTSYSVTFLLITNNVFNLSFEIKNCLFFVQRLRYNIPSWKLQFWHAFTNVFQESRKLVIAQLQNIVYNHFLPEILSPEILDKFGLKMASDSTYFPEANPTLKNEFSTAANRYGHSQIQVPQNSVEIQEFFCQWEL